MKGLGYRFKRQDLLTQALTHRSYAVEAGERGQDNERLEFLGDAVLELAVSHLLFDRYAAGSSEGEMTKLRSCLVNEASLASKARQLELGPCLRLGRGEEMSGGREKDSILADAFEALLGAIYLDGGFQEAFDFVDRLFGPEMSGRRNLTAAGKDHKTELQELTQAACHRVPSYILEKSYGPDHDKRFRVALYLEGRLLARGEGKSKKEAEQTAAGVALKTVSEWIENGK